MRNINVLNDTLTFNFHMDQKPLALFLTLSKIEESSLDHFRLLYKRLNIENSCTSYTDQRQLLDKIAKLDPAPLIKLAITDPEFDKLCKNPLLNDIWNEQWRLSGRNIREKANKNKLPIHEYMPQATTHTFELLKGIYIYGQYKKCLKASDAQAQRYSADYLKLAADLGYFAALNALCTEYLQEPSLQAQQALLYAQTAAKLYWTPGYLLLAVVNYSFGNYRDALLNLIIAEKLIPYSEAMINNAYQGKTVEEIVSRLNFRNWDYAKIHIAEWADLPLSWVVDKLYPIADIEVTHLLGAVDLGSLSIESEISANDESSSSEYPSL